MSRRPRLNQQTTQKIKETQPQQCAYCHAKQEYVYYPLEVEHITPVSKGGSNEAENLCLACKPCNGHKSDKTTEVDPETEETVALFNPNTQNWDEHFDWDEDGILLTGLTPTGRATIKALKINDDPIAIQVRRNWVAVGWHPPKK